MRIPFSVDPGTNGFLMIIIDQFSHKYDNFMENFRSTLVKVNRVEVHLWSGRGHHGQIAGREADKAVVGCGDGQQIVDSCYLLWFACGNADTVDGLAGLEEILEVDEAAVMRPGWIAHAVDGERSPALRGAIEEHERALVERH